MAKNPVRANAKKHTQEGRLNLPAFRRAVWAYYKGYGRYDLPWRRPSLKLRSGKQDFDPYRIMVSEVMLQQTQVPRVLEKYKEFLEAFPNVHALANASLSDVLKVWSGLGYNRRGKFLRDAAIAIVQDHGGKVPRDAATLRTIPGIGPYTASAILIFAFNIPDTLIETNVRSAFIHHFFTTPANSLIGEFAGVKKRKPASMNSDRVLISGKKVSDRELLPLITAAAEGQDPREWHWALMDYGSYLKKAFPNPSRSSASHVKQSKFEGSLRQVRGAILRELHDGPLTEAALGARLDALLKLDAQPRLIPALAALVQEGMVARRGRRWRIC